MRRDAPPELEEVVLVFLLALRVTCLYLEALHVTQCCVPDGLNIALWTCSWYSLDTSARKGRGAEEDDKASRTFPDQIGHADKGSE